jgi:hypothetical protein
MTVGFDFEFSIAPVVKYINPMGRYDVKSKGKAWYVSSLHEGFTCLIIRSLNVFLIAMQVKNLSISNDPPFRNFGKGGEG